MELVGFYQYITIILQPVDDTVDICLLPHLQTLGNHLIRRRNPMNTNVCFYEIKDKLSAGGHLAAQMFKQTQFKRKHERSQVLL